MLSIKKENKTKSKIMGGCGTLEVSRILFITSYFFCIPCVCVPAEAEAMSLPVRLSIG